MRTKILLCMICSLFFIGKNQAQSKFYLSEDQGIIPMSISFDGKYVTGGKSNNEGFIWEYAENEITSLASETVSFCMGRKITNNKVVAGIFGDPSHLLPGETGDVPAKVAGIWQNGQWTRIAQILGSLGDEASIATTVNESGTIAAGAIYEDVGYGFTKLLPAQWKYEAGQWVMTKYELPPGAMEGMIVGMSADGSLACGWTDNLMVGGQVPVVWTSPTEPKIISMDLGAGQCDKISKNGKYVVLTVGATAYCYNIETEELTFVGGQGISVTDNGWVLGFNEIDYGPAGWETRGFMWNEKTGAIDMADVVANYASDLTLPDGFFTDNNVLKTPVDISEDGTTIVGFRTYDLVEFTTWVLKLAQPIKPFNRPRNLTFKGIDIFERNKVELSWMAPEPDESETLTGYKVFRNSNLVASIPANQLVYINTNVPAGYQKYAVSAVYVNGESNFSIPVTVPIIDNYDLPFFDNFKNGGLLTANYWTVTSTSENSFAGFAYERGFVPGTTSATFFAIGEGIPYTTSLISKPLDASLLDNVYVSYLFNLTAMFGMVTIVEPDTLYLEVMNLTDKTEWQLVKKYIGNLTTWNNDEVDISSFVKGKLFRIRWRVGGNDKTRAICWNFDHIRVSPTKGDNPPQSITGEKQGDKMSLRWQDPAGSYALSYCSAFPINTIGDEGVPFIAANKFEPADLVNYEGQFLTSITAYFYQYDPTATAQFRLAVFIDGVRVCSQNIPEFTPYAWNTYKLAEPIPISTDQTLMLGIEVVEHSVNEQPICCDNNGVPAYGKGDLFSEDGGKTWQRLSDNGLDGNWAIIGNVRKSEAEEERDGSIFGYDIYRDGVKINNEMLFKQTFIDNNPTPTACYTVRACSGTRGLSAFSPEYCNESIIKIQDDHMVIYPNPARDYLHIDSEFIRATIIDLQGRTILEAIKTPINITDLKNGMYLLKLDTKEGIATKKIVISK